MTVLALEDGGLLVLEDGATEILVSLEATTGYQFGFGFGSDWTTPEAEVGWVWATGTVDGAGGLSVDRGRQSERDVFKAGTASFRLNNPFRIFDPAYVDGPYYGLLVPGVPCVIRRIIDGVTFNLYRGFVDDWPRTDELSNAWAWVDIVCTDLFGILSRTRTPDSLYDFVVASDTSLKGYWKLTETAGDTAVDSSGNGLDGTYRDTAETGPGLVHGTDAQHFSGKRDAVDLPDRARLVDAAVPLSETTFTVDLWFRTSAEPAATEYDTLYHESSSTSTLLIALTETGAIGALVGSTLNDTPAEVYLETDTSGWNDGKPHHLSFSSSPTDTDFEIDGVERAWTQPAVIGTASQRRVTIGGHPSPLSARDYFEGEISHVSTYTTARGAEGGIELYQAGYRPWDGDTSGQRLNRLLDLVGLDPADRDIADGFTTLGPVTLGGEYLLTLAKAVEASEQARMFIAADGRFTFLPRYHEDTADPVEVELLDTAFPTGDLVTYGPPLVNEPQEFIHNKVSVTADGNAEITVEDAASIRQYGERPLTIDAPLMRTPRQQRSLAKYVLIRDKDPHTRATGVRVALVAGAGPDVEAADRALAAKILALDIGHRVSFTRTPQGIGDAITGEQIIEGIKVEASGLGPDEVTYVDLYLSPATSLSWFRAGVSLVGGPDVVGF